MRGKKLGSYGSPPGPGSGNYRAFTALHVASDDGRMITPSARRAAFPGENTMSTTETAAPAPAAPADAGKKCCGPSCCSKTGCGTGGKCCVCCGGCGGCLGYIGAALLTAAGLTALYAWMTSLWPAYAIH